MKQSGAEQNPPGKSNARRPLLNADGSIDLGPLHLPFSNLASAEAREVFLSELSPPPAEVSGDPLALRRHHDRNNARLASRMRELFAVDVDERELGGVRVHRVAPPAVSPENLGRALICLHGGGFTWGAKFGALVEAIPIAATLGVEVVAVDYRLGPEHVFPAASEDVAQVYGALLERRRPEALGVFGCSAGALLTAQSMAWFARVGLPRPGAIAMLGAGAGELEGDLTYLSPALEGLSPAQPLGLSSFGYFKGAAFNDPCVAPINDLDVLGRFPPTLLIAGGRDFGAGAITRLHLSLDALGVETRLFIFDGLWHAFHIFPELPESRRVYEIMAKFFDQRLGRGADSPVQGL